MKIFYVYSLFLARYTILEENWRLLDTRVILLVIEFLLFRIKKDQNKTKRLQESIR